MLEFFSPRLGQYENFTFNNRSFVSFKVIIAGIFFGVILAAFFAVYNRRVLGAFVREIIKRKAFSKESALTLEELGFSKNPFVKLSLLHGSTLKKAVKCVEEEAFRESLSPQDAQKGKINAKFKVDPKTARFYIPEEKQHKMYYKFEAKGSGWLAFAITAVLATVITALIVRYLPSLLALLDSFL